MNAVNVTATKPPPTIAHHVRVHSDSPKGTGAAEFVGADADVKDDKVKRAKFAHFSYSDDGLGTSQQQQVALPSKAGPSGVGHLWQNLMDDHTRGRQTPRGPPPPPPPNPSVDFHALFAGMTTTLTNVIQPVAKSAADAAKSAADAASAPRRHDVSNILR